MKKFVFAILVLCSAIANAAVVPVLEAELPALRGQAFADARFHMDTQTTEGFVKVSVVEEEVIYHHGRYDFCHWDRGPYGPGPWGPRYRRCYPPMPTTIRTNVLKDTVKVEGLTLAGKKIVYQGENGEVDCGTLGVSRVLRVPTLYLNGNCTLEARLSGPRHRSKVVVTLKTK